jgi:hypothetical protein
MRRRRTLSLALAVQLLPALLLRRSTLEQRDQQPDTLTARLVVE